MSTALLFINGFATDASIWELQTDVMEDIVQKDKNSSDKEYVVVGWSMGAFDAVKFYFRNKDKVKGLVLVSATPKFTNSNEYELGLPLSVLKTLERRIKADFEGGINYFYSLIFNGGKIHPLIKSLPKPNKTKIFADLERLKTEDMRDLLSQIEVPVLLIHGDQDQICLPSASGYMRDKIPNAQLEIFEGVAHAPFLEEPEKFNQILKEFVN